MPTSTPTPDLFPRWDEFPTRTPDPAVMWYGFQNIAVSPDGEQLVLSRPTGIQVYNLSSGEIVYSYDYKYAGKRFGGTYTQMTWSPDGNYLAVGTQNDGVYIWRTAPWEFVTEMGDHGMEYQPTNVWNHPGFDWSPDGKQLVLGVLARYNQEGIKKGEILIWDAETNAWEQFFVEDDYNDFFNVRWKADGQIVILGQKDETVVVLDISSGSPIAVDELNNVYGFPPISAIWSPDDRYICFYNDIGGTFYDLQTKTWTDRNCYPQFAWSADGAHLATIDVRNRISIWDPADNEYTRLEIRGEALYELVWSPTKEWYVLGFVDQKVVVWNANTGEVILEIE